LLLVAITLQIALAWNAYAVVGEDDSARFAGVGVPRSFPSAPGVSEEVFAARRGPSPFDRIAVHRYTRSPADSGETPVVLCLPGTWMNGTAAPEDPRYSLALFLAARGVDF